MPVVEKGTVTDEDWGERPVEKYRCPACAEKELPFLDPWVAARAWNMAAPKRSYHRRTLEYNIHGVCVGEPYREYEWRDKKKQWFHVTITFYLDNGVYYYRYDYWYRNGGAGSGLSINTPGFPSFDMAKKNAAKELVKRGKKGIANIVKKLLFSYVQGELF
jgi:hypothetical protein